MVSILEKVVDIGFAFGSPVCRRVLRWPRLNDLLYRRAVRGLVEVRGVRQRSQKAGRVVAGSWVGK